MAPACLLPGCLTLVNLCLERVSDSSGPQVALPDLLWMDLGNWGFTSRRVNTYLEISVWKGSAHRLAVFGAREK